ncbi:MAG: protein kinase [Kofleriaceae bacterium]|nr:protein kinase [Kofleriaceae bacterium]
MWTCPQCRLAVPDGRFCPADGTALRLEIDGLVVGRELGRGMTGTVYEAAAAGAPPVAIKVLHGEWIDDPEMRARFEREVRAAAAVRHPSLVTARGHGVLGDGRPYLVMELIDGPQLDEVLALGPLGEPRAIELTRELAGALAALHQAGVVHRDVKPGNIKIGRDGRARLLDLGVARRIDGDEARLTGGGLTVGTPHYMAPEQCTGEAIDGRTDVYALGVTLYRMITGALPFDGAAVAVMLAHTSRAPEPPSARVAVSAPLEALVMACLAKRPDDRPDARGLAAALEALAWGEAPDPWAATVPFERGAGRAATVRAADDEADDEAATSTSASAFVGEAATAATPDPGARPPPRPPPPWLAAAAVVSPPPPRCWR